MSARSFCGTAEQLQDHHVYPKCHYGKGQDNRYTVKLCAVHHRRIENYILGVESFLTGNAYGSRYKLEKEDYEKILRTFLARSRIIHMAG